MPRCRRSTPSYVWIFILGFIGALVAGCVWYFFSDDKKEKQDGPGSVRVC